MFENILKGCMTSELILGIVVVILIYVFIKLKVKKKKKFPPGPMSLPIVGYLPFLGKKPYLVFSQLAKKYGPVYSLRLGMKDVVILNNAKSIREAFSKPELLGRPELSLFDIVDIISPFFVNGKMWKQQRRFAVQTLRDLGLGKSIMHDRITEEIHHFLDHLKAANGNPIQLKQILVPSMSNNICSLVFGTRYEYNDPSRILLDESLEEQEKCFSQTSYQLFFPWMNSIPILRNLFLNAEELVEKFQCTVTFIRKQIETHKSSLDVNHPSDYIDKFLIEMKAHTMETDSTFNEKVLLGCVYNLFAAGSETVQTTINWCFYVMAAYPTIQAKVQKEIDDVIGYERFPTFSDQKDMPYTLAVLFEIQRHFTVVPINLLRYVLEDTTFCGYDVPKGTYVLANFWATHHDPDSWNNPSDFYPDRFLSKDKKSVVKSDAYMPFSYGKRNCPGEGLAILEVFLYFTAILQKFKLRFPDGYVADFEGEADVTYHVKPYEIRIILRH